MSIPQIVNDHIREEYLDGQSELGHEEDLLGYPTVDSLAVVGIVAFLEKEFVISIPPVDVTLENFRTVKAIALYVEGRRTLN